MTGVVHVCVAMKPLDGNFAENALRHGVAGLNIDGCRVRHSEECRMMKPSQANIDNPSEKCQQAGRREAVLELKPQGRWPANIIHDGSEQVVEAFPVTGKSKVQARNQKARPSQHSKGAELARVGTMGHNDNGGSAARFFKKVGEFEV